MRHRRRVWRWRRRAVLVLLVFIAAAAIAYQHFTSSERVAAMAARALEDLTGAEVKVESAHFGLNGVIVLHNVEFRVPALPGGADKLFTAEQVLIRHDLWGLLQGKFDARDIVVLQPTVYITDVIEDGKYNFQFLKKETTGGPPTAPVELPQIYIYGGTAVFGDVEGDRYTERLRSPIGGSLTRAPEDHSGQTYQFALYHTVVGQPLGLLCTGRFDLGSNTIAGRLERLQIHSSQREMLPRWLRRQGELLDAEGEVPTLDFAYSPNHGFAGSVELMNVGMTLPLGDEYQTRVLAETGRLTMSRDGIQISDLTGRVEDFHYRITGRIDPHLGESTGPAGSGGAASPPMNKALLRPSFQLMIDVDGELPRRAAYVSNLPRLAQQLERMFDPAGLFDAKVTITKSANDARIAYDGVLHIHDGSGWYWRFPYPIRGVTGDVHFSNERVEIVNVHGTAPSDGDITINGLVAPPNEEAGVHVAIAARGLPLDEHLYEAVTPRQRSAIERYVDLHAEQRLIDEGVIQTAALKAERGKQLAGLEAQKATIEKTITDLKAAATMPADVLALGDRIAALRAQVATPVYEVGGTIDADIDIVRPPGPRKEYTTAVDVNLAGVNGLMTFWPYPMHVQSGRMKITPGEVKVTELTARSIDGAVAHATGAFIAGAEDQESVPRFDFDITGLSLDPLLRASLPEPYATWMKKLAITGKLDAKGTAEGAMEKAAVDLKLAASLHDGRVQPFGGRFIVEDLAGQFQVGDHQATVQSLTGRHGESSYALSGAAGWTTKNDLWVDMKVGGKNLRFEEPYFDALPPEGIDAAAVKNARDLYDQVKPAGTFDLDGAWTLKDGKSDYTGHVQPHALSFNYRDRRLELSEMTGTVTVTPGLARVEKLTAHFGEGVYGADGAITLGDKRDYDLSIDGEGKSLDKALRSVAPDAWLKTVDQLRFAGGFRTQGLHAVMKDDATALDGTIALQGASAMIGLPIRDFDGELAMKVRVPPADGEPSIDATLKGKTLRVSDRELESLSLRAVSKKASDGLEIRDLKASMYNGTVIGQGEFLPGEGKNGRGLYSLKMNMTDVMWDSFLHPERAGKKVADNEKPTGKLSGSLSVEGSVTDATDRRGRGEIQVREAKLYELPVAFAMINLINLSLDASRSFDRASVQYVIDGDNVMLDSVKFETPGVQIAGSGTMKLSTRALDLQMYSKNPNNPIPGPPGEILNLIKDELVSVHVGGTLDKPAAKVQSFSGTSRTWDEIWGGKKSDLISPVVTP